MTTPTMTLDCDGFADALPDYLEGDAPDHVRSAIDAHASSCSACRQLLADLNAIRVDAAALPTLVPSRDLWEGIAERLDTRVIPMTGRASSTAAPNIAAASDIPRTRIWWQPAVAAAALIIATAGITHFLTRASLTTPASITTASAVRPTVTPKGAVPEATGEFTSTATEQASARPVAASRQSQANKARLASAEPLMNEAEPVFASEISKLRKIVRDRKSELDPKTVAVLEQSIAVMDSAIAQSRAALLKDPASGFLASQLNHSLEKKVELLKTAAQLPSRI